MTPSETQPTRRAVTRDEVIALGRAGRPRQFLPLAAQIVERVPGDEGLRFLLAANVAQLGLRTLAREILDSLAHARRDPEVARLAEAVEQLPDDRVALAVRLATALGNLRALRVRGVDLAGPFEAWREDLARSQCFRCADGNLVRRLGRAGAPPWTHFLADQRGAAEQFARARLAGADLFPRPLAIEGIDPPWLFDLAWRTLARNRIGYAPPITIVQADPMEFLDGLSAADLREQLVDPRVRVFVGPDASQRWLNDALERLDEVVLGGVVTLPGTRTRVSPAAEAVMGRASAAQAEEFRRVQARVEAAYRDRDAPWWSRRYSEAAAGGPPLRVLVPTSRFSTYIRHAAEDLAEAFRALGCEAMVATEPRPEARLSAVGHARVVERFEPDLIALINYFRGDADLPYPANVPWLCWVQDALPHQFTERAWGELDFIAGHVHRELSSRESFPRERAVQFPVVASARKFHEGPIDPGMRARFAGEIAYVSHQSETPAAFHERSRREANNEGAGRLLDELRPLVEAEAAEPMGSSLAARLEALTRRVVGERAERGVTYLFRHYALPLADRVLRHQTLEWAAEICRRRGWRLRIYGRGWESHPTLSGFARAELSHGEELRACYQASLVHLHASASALVHQRVMECALSGGLPLARLTYDAVSESTGWGQREALLHARAPLRDEATGKIGLVVADSPALGAIAEQRRRIGMDLPEIVWISAARAASYRRPDHPGATGLHPAWLLGDFAEATFRTAQELERLVDRALQDPQARRERSHAMAERVRARCTTEVFAGRMLGLISESLAKAAGPRQRAA